MHLVYLRHLSRATVTLGSLLPTSPQVQRQEPLVRYFKLYKVGIAPQDDYCPSLAKEENQASVPLRDVVKYLVLDGMHLGLSIYLYI